MNVTREEYKLVELHARYYGEISVEQINRAWRDSDGLLCVEYKMRDGDMKWWHYNGKDKEWW